MSHSFWHPLKAFDRLPGGWELRDEDGKRVLGAVLRESDGRYTCWTKSGEAAESAGYAWTLPKAAQKVWNATHATPWGGFG